DERRFVRRPANVGVAANHGEGEKVHEADEAGEQESGLAGAPGPAGRHHPQPVAPGETQLVTREPDDRGRVAHAAAASLATRCRNVSSRLEPDFPVWRRSSSSVPCAIRRPPSMMPMRSAMRSATSRIWVVMMTVL